MKHAIFVFQQRNEHLVVFMANLVQIRTTCLLFLSTFFHCVHHSNQQQLQPFQSNALREIQQFLNNPPLLNIFYTTWDFCNIEPSPFLTVVCYEDNVTQLHITGNNGDFPPLLPRNFSIDALFSSISSLPNLKVLSLVSLGLWGTLPATIGKLSSMEILNLSSNYIDGFIPSELSYLTNLQTLVLDHNKFTGRIPGWITSFNDLAVLGLRNNSLFGSLPVSISSLKNLRVLAMADNHLFGEIPNLQNLTNLQVLDLKNNYFGPNFPVLRHNKIVAIELRNNSFQSSIPDELSSYFQLEKLDISINGFIGPFPPSLLSLPSINYIDISSNKLTGKLSQNMSCNAYLVFVNLSTNLLTGDLPTCLQQQNNIEKKDVLFGGNCLSGEEDQHPLNFCHNEALAVKVLPEESESKEHKAMAVVGSSLVGGIVGLSVVVGLSFWVFRRRKGRAAMKGASTRLICEKICTVNTVKLLSDARCISETMRMGANLPTYRAFSLEELMDATDNFSHSTILSEGSLGQIYRGKLGDGTAVVIRSLKMRKKHSQTTFTQHIEMISKLRHTHLVSCIGHSFECCPHDSSTVSIIYFVFQYLPNSTLRSSICGQRINWAQRITAGIGIAKGIQFLHTGMIPGVFSNNLKITDVLLDHDFHVKICSYNLPLLTDNGGIMGGAGVSSNGLKSNVGGRGEEKDKDDIHDIGVILLEILVGRPIMSQNDVMVVKDILQVSNKMDDTARRSIVDPAIIKECSAESLQTVIEICLRCLSDNPTDRPSIEDVLWTMQFASQLQDPCRRDSHRVHHPSVSPSSSL